MNHHIHAYMIECSRFFLTKAIKSFEQEWLHHNHVLMCIAIFMSDSCNRTLKKRDHFLLMLLENITKSGNSCKGSKLHHLMVFNAVCGLGKPQSRLSCVKFTKIYVAYCT